MRHPVIGIGFGRDQRRWRPVWVRRDWVVGANPVVRINRRLDAAQPVVGLRAQKIAGSPLLSATLRYICRAAHGRMAVSTAATLLVAARTASGVGAGPPAVS